MDYIIGPFTILAHDDANWQPRDRDEYEARMIDVEKKIRAMLRAVLWAAPEHITDPRYLRVELEDGDVEIAPGEQSLEILADIEAAERADSDAIEAEDAAHGRAMDRQNTL